MLESSRRFMTRSSLSPKLRRRFSLAILLFGVTKCGVVKLLSAYSHARIAGSMDSKQVSSVPHNSPRTDSIFS